MISFNALVPAMRRRAGGLSGHRISMVLLFLLATVFFFPLFHGYTFTTVAGHHCAVFPWHAFNPQYDDCPQSDQADLNYPWRTFVRKTIRQGDFPFWNPYSFAGEPFFANGSSAVVYPPQFLASLLFPPDWEHDILSFFHVFASGLFMYLLLREFQVGVAGALLAAVAWMFSSFNLAWLHLEVVAPISMFLPLSVLLVARAFRRRTWGGTVGAAVALAAVFVSGHLLFCGLVYGIAVAYAACLTLGSFLPRPAATASAERSPRGPAPLLQLMVIVIGPMALAAGALWPTFLALHALGRESLPYQMIHEGIRVPYRLFLSMLAPPPLPPTESVMHRMVFVGTLPALLALVGVFRRGRGAMFARILVVVVFLVATDTLLLKPIYAVLPQFSFFSPLGRLLNLFGFGVAVLAGMGLDAIASKIRQRSIANVLILGVISFTAWQLIAYGRNINPPFVPREAQYLYPETPLIGALKQAGAVNATASGRILPLQRSQQHGWTPPILFANEAMLFGIDSAGGYDSTLPSRSETIWRIVAGQDPRTVLDMKYRRAFSSLFDARLVRFALLPRVGVTMLVAAPGVSEEPFWTPKRYAPLQLQSQYSGTDGQIFSIRGANGGPWVVHRAEAAETEMAALQRFLDDKFDVTRSVVLEYPDTAGLPSSSAAPLAATGTAVVREDGINALNVLATSSHAGWLVIPNSWDTGWQAWVNGRQTKVLRGNYAFQVVAIPPGTSDVRLRYRPAGLLTGCAISALAFLAATAVLLQTHCKFPSKQTFTGRRS